MTHQAIIERVGIDVRVSHHRYVGDTLVPCSMIRASGASLEDVDHFGGMTVATVRVPDGTEEGRVFTASASCSRRDRYCKTVGREIAVGRALRKAGLLDRPAEPVRTEGAYDDDELLQAARELGIDLRAPVTLGRAS